MGVDGLVELAFEGAGFAGVEGTALRCGGSPAAQAEDVVDWAALAPVPAPTST